MIPEWRRYVLDSGVKVFRGDSLDVLRCLKSNSLDAMVTDPPAGISFMLSKKAGSTWDSDRGGRKKWVAWLASIMREAFRVLKPGAHILVWSIPRTTHWTGTAIEDAGFEPRDVVTAIYGTGFPKSQNVSKAIDKKLGKKRKLRVNEMWAKKYPNGPGGNLTGGDRSDKFSQCKRITGGPILTSDPVSKLPKMWEGFGSALKPSCEMWWLARKPLSGTIVDNLLKHGTGALNIEASRVEAHARPAIQKVQHGENTEGTRVYGGGFSSNSKAVGKTNLGRFPANLLLSHHRLCRKLGTKFVKGDNRKEAPDAQGKQKTWLMKGRTKTHGKVHGDALSVRWECEPSCPIALIDKQSGVKQSSKKGAIKRKLGRGDGCVAYGSESRKPGTEMLAYGDKGGASRFFQNFHPKDDEPFLYCPKPSAREKNLGCDHLAKKTAEQLTGRKKGSPGLVMKHKDGSEKANPYAGTSGQKPRGNTHVTVKSVTLMSWLIRLITPPGGKVLDPFLGSGTTGVSAVHGGFKFTGIEREIPYSKIALARIRHALKARDPWA